MRLVGEVQKKGMSNIDQKNENREDLRGKIFSLFSVMLNLNLTSHYLSS
jgi:hypothetical protein